MSSHRSARQRLDRLREEAEIRTSERVVKERKEANEGRLIAVWAVKTGMGEIVATYPYARKADAEREAVRLHEADRATYIVAPHRMPLES
jgi:hypothetical protein